MAELGRRLVGSLCRVTLGGGSAIRNPSIVAAPGPGVAMQEMIRVFAAQQGVVVEADGRYRRLPQSIGFDAIFTAEEPVRFVRELAASATEVPAPAASECRAPIESQEVWAAGVTYLRSRTARMEEAKDAGGGDF